MVEEGPGSAENDPPAAEPQPKHDFSVVQGFQVVGAEGLSRAGDEAWREALRLELEARAARLHQAVDAAIVLSNDGIIRWLGDPVAKLSAGPNVLNPGAVTLADESLPDASRETVKTRIELWIAATTRRLLGPLFALEAIQAGSEIVRDLAQELVRSLGVLEREPIRAKIKALTQDDRGELRKQGARFGAYYIFLPALLKPAARTLALQLWSLQASGDASELIPTLGAVASSGRTSLPLDKAIWKEGYRVAGYRPCGERVVRVDVVERLSGMIRAAIAGEAPAGAAKGLPSQRTSKGFLVSGAMTSLTGCSGEPFASILRSMGFRSVEMKRSEFFGSPSAAEGAQQGEPPKPGDIQEPAEVEEAAAPAASEDQAPADLVSAAPVADGVLAGAEGLDDLAEGAESAPEDPGSVAEAGDAVSEPVHGATEGGEETPEDPGAVSEVVDTLAEAVGPETERAEGVTPETAPSSVLSDPSGSGSAAGAIEQAAAPQTPGAGCELAKSDELITVWRPDHRRTSTRRDRESKQSRNEGPARSEGPGRSDARGHSPAAAPNWRREAGAPAAKRPNRPNSGRNDEKRRQRPHDYDMARSSPPTAPQQPAKVDPNSPFAKLLELRPLLEEQANKRQ
jgi:ATP-dependent RNA helicase SUPV3L1/SUV3